MAKKNMKTALNSSLKAESDAVKSRFERADQAFNSSLEEEQATDTNTSSPQKKEKVIRDSFTLPNSDYELIAAIQERCLHLATNVNKSEVIRAGLHALTELSDEALLAVVDNLTKVKTGRPRKSK